MKYHTTSPEIVGKPAVKRSDPMPLFVKPRHVSSQLWHGSPLEYLDQKHTEIKQALEFMTLDKKPQTFFMKKRLDTQRKSWRVENDKIFFSLF